MQDSWTYVRLIREVDGCINGRKRKRQPKEKN
jgi:hypothetical protein